MANRKINTGELDFDAIKQNLIDFLKGQSEFTDYDFQGSGLSVILDVLSYNTHYNGLYNNMAVNEAFLDTASKRNSVVSLAKNLGYIPSSVKSSLAEVNLVIQGVPEANITTYLHIPKYSQFTASVIGVGGSKNYTFYTIEDYLATEASGSYTFTGVKIKEGVYSSISYEVLDGQRFVIPNSNCDTETITVTVKDSTLSTDVQEYVNAKTVNKQLVDLDATDKIYFLKEIEDGKYEIEFGNGVIGSKPANGNLVSIQYLISSKADANGAKTFSYDGSTLGGSSYVQTISVASGGAEAEDIEIIRYNAPKLFAAQSRCVTVSDYSSMILNNFSGNIQSINVWGGEDNIVSFTPYDSTGSLYGATYTGPIYGRVFISIKPTDSDYLTSAEKNYIKNTILKPRNVIGVTPELVDAEFIDVIANITAYYNPKVTTLSANDLRLQVLTAITNYNTTELNRFDNILRISKMQSVVDASNTAIVGNITTLLLRKEMIPDFGNNRNYVLYLMNPFSTDVNTALNNNSVSSTGFYILNSTELHYFDDEYLGANSSGKNIGNLRMYKLSMGEKVIVRTFANAVDYDNGVITITDLTITGIDSNTSGLTITVKPESYDIASVNNQIVRLSMQDLVIDVIQDSLSLDNTGGGTYHKFTSSRS